MSKGLVVSDFWLKNIVLYKKARFKFTPGLTFVQAVNLNRPGQGSNYSGKSLLFTSLANAMLNTEPLITKNARTLQKDIFSKGSEVGFNLSRANKRYVLVKTRTKTKVEKDGEPQELRTQALATDYVQKLLGTNEEEFFTLNYIDSRRPSSFQFGTSASRFEFFTNLFRLGDLDEARKWLRTELTKLRENQGVVDRIRQELKELGKARDSDTLQSKVKQLIAQQKELSKLSRSIQKQLHLADMYRMYRPLKKEYDELSNDLKTTSPRKEIREIEERLEVLERHRDENSRIREQAKHRENLREKLEQLSTPKKLARAKISKIRHIIDKIEDIVRECSKVQKPEKVKEVDREALRKAIRKVGYKKLPKDLSTLADELERRVSKMEGKAETLLEERSEFEKHFAHAEKETQCPQCKTVLTVRTCKSVLKGLTAQAEAIDEQVELNRAARRLLQSHLAYGEYEKDRKIWDKARARLQVVEKYDVAALESYISIKERLEELPVKIEELFGDPRDEERKLRRRREALQKLSSLKTQLEDFKDLDELKHAGTLDAKELKRKQRKTDEKIEAVLEKLPHAQSKLDAIKEHNSRRKVLKSELKELSSELSDIPLYEAMIDAYSTSGMKMLLIKKIASMVQKNMNAAAKLLYQEPYSFELNVENNRFDAIVHRTLAGKVSSSDIRRMSGAESRIFTLMFLLSILPFIPQERRLNFLILDEPGENLDAGMMQIFRDVLLPRLAKIVPSVVVISPKDDLIVPGQRLLTVVKKGAHSTIVEGRYLEAANNNRVKKEKKAA